jgi:hypothetical protein
MSNRRDSRIFPVARRAAGSSVDENGYDPTREAAMAAFAKSWRRA